MHAPLDVEASLVVTIYKEQAIEASNTLSLVFVIRAEGNNKNRSSLRDLHSICLCMRL